MLTNLGKIDPVTLENGARVRSVAFMVSPPPQHPFCVTTASYADCMYLKLLYDECKLDAQQAQRIANTMIGFISAAAKG